MQAIKVAAVLHPLQPLGHPQLFQKKSHERHKMKVLFLTLLLCVVCAAQEEEAEQSVSEVPGMADLAGGLGVCVCLCVCVCVCVSPFGSFLMWIHKPIHLPSTQHYSISWLYTCSIWSASPLVCTKWLSWIFPTLVTEKEDQPNSCWSACIWHQNLSSLRNVSIPSFPLTSFICVHYFTHPALSSQVR